MTDVKLEAIRLLCMYVIYIQDFLTLQRPSGS